MTLESDKTGKFKAVYSIVFVLYIYKRACTLVQKSYYYTPGVHGGVRVGVSVHIQNVRANVKVLEFQSFCISSCI